MNILWNAFYFNSKQSKTNPYIKQNKHSYSIRTKAISCQTRGCDSKYAHLKKQNKLLLELLTLDFVCQYFETLLGMAFI